MVGRFGGPRQASIVVQAMAPPGVSVVVGVVDDPSFGPVMSFGLAGAAMELLGDRAYRILPAGDAEVAELVRSVKAAPLLFGYRGAEPVDVAALEELLLRVGCLAEDLPEVAEVRLAPVTVAAQGLAVLHAEVSLAPLPARTAWGPRALTPAL
jgi:acyl-CoA synthetase (NDP forming)